MFHHNVLWFLLKWIAIPFSIFYFVYAPFYMALHCSIVECASASQPLTFGTLPQVSLALPEKPRERVNEPEVLHGSAPSRDEMLDVACNGDRKCKCVVEAIAIMDSSFATAGVGARALNPCNMRRPGSWTPKGIKGETSGAVGHFLVFDSLQSGVTACAETYNRFYTELNAKQLVKRWAQSSNPDYIAKVAKCL